MLAVSLTGPAQADGAPAANLVGSFNGLIVFGLIEAEEAIDALSEVGFQRGPTAEGAVTSAGVSSVLVTMADRVIVGDRIDPDFLSMFPEQMRQGMARVTLDPAVCNMQTLWMSDGTTVFWVVVQGDLRAAGPNESLPTHCVAFTLAAAMGVSFSRLSDMETDEILRALAEMADR